MNASLSVRSRLLAGEVLALGLLAAQPVAAQPASAFTYQGRLDQDGVPATGVYDLRFSYFSSEAGPGQFGQPACADNVTVENGLFTVIVPLLAPPSGEAWLQVEFREDTGLDCAALTGFTPLAPRQRVTPSPRAVYALALGTEGIPSAGGIRFDPDLKRIEVFDGDWWRPIELGPAVVPDNILEFVTNGSTNFIVPPGVTGIFVEVWGAGGGGGGRGPGTVATAPDCGTFAVRAGAGGGGGGGAFARALLTVIPGEVLQLQIGDGGAGALFPGTSGTAGQTTAIRRGVQTILSAAGGFGGGAGGNAPMVEAPSPCSNALPFTSSGGTGGALPVLSGPGELKAALAGITGSPGRGAGWDEEGFPIPDCDLFTGCPGSGAAPRPGVTDLPNLVAGFGGSGGAASNAPTGGADGAIRIWWY
jgi:hypothetical protein